jgi:hypothetical protein
MLAGYSLPSLLATYFRETAKLDTAGIERHHLRRLEQLGYTVTLKLPCSCAVEEIFEG